jgi:hypothetical protein
MPGYPDISGARGGRHLVRSCPWSHVIGDGLGINRCGIIISRRWVEKGEGHGQIEPEPDIGVGGRGGAERQCRGKEEEGLVIHGCI